LAAIEATKRIFKWIFANGITILSILGFFILEHTEPLKKLGRNVAKGR
jgi:Ni,Fe-hydrogenase I cytochrome b subunit